jgi:cytochrome P450
MPDDAVGQPFSPPGPHPGSHQANLFHLLRWGMSRPLDAWPRAVFEELSYRAPAPSAPLFLMDPEAIRAVFVDEADAFTPGAMSRRLWRPIWGDGILTSEGAAWRWQRRASAPAFRPTHMHALAPLMGRAAQAALDRWGPSAQVDVAQEAAKVTFDALLDCLLSGGEDFERASMRARITAFLSKVMSPRLSFFMAQDSWHEGRSLPPAPGAESLRRDVDAMIRRRRRAEPRGDLVDLLLQAHDPDTGHGMDDAILRDNLLGFIVAGYQTSSVALTWSIYLASAHAPTAARLRAEIEAVAGDAPIVAEHVEKLIFTRQVVSEALRLYPPGFQLYRVCVRETIVKSHRFRPGDKVLIPVYALHRHRRWWKDPDVFDPDRFAPGKPPTDRHLYMPFGAGGRVCLGAAFAMTELVVMLATLIRGATFTVDPNHRVWPGTAMEMLPRGGLPMRVEARTRV